MSAKFWLALVMALLAATPALARRDRGEQDSRPVQQAVPEQRLPIFPGQGLQPPADPRRLQRDGRGRYFSPEERRQLRRDINEAGRDIYRPERDRR